MALIRAQAWRDALEGKLSEVYRDRLGAAVLREYEAGPDAVCPQKKEDVFHVILSKHSILIRLNVSGQHVSLINILITKVFMIGKQIIKIFYI